MQAKPLSVWKKLSRNIPAIAGLSIILLTILVAVFAYVLAPDNTSFADLQTVEIQAKQPGYKQLFLKIPARGVKRVSTFRAFLFGKPSKWHFVPVTSFHLENNTLHVQKFVDDDTAVAQQYKLASLGVTKENFRQLIVSKTYWLGTDAFGRDILSRLIVGTRISLAVGLIAVMISLTLGILLGAAAGYFKGRVDAAIMWLINVTWSIPTLLLVFAITLVMGKGFWQIFIAVGLTLWVSVARIVRGQVLGISQLEFVQAAKAMGFSNARIILRHILPNIIGPIMVVAAGNVASAIIIEAGLSFLGIGVQPPQPSWGLMIKENYNFIITHSPFLAIIPGIAIMLLVLAFNLLGNGLRDAFDVKN